MVFVRPDTRAFLDLLAAQDGPKTYEVDPATARMMMQMLAGMADPPVGDLAVIRDLAAPGPAGDIPLRLFDAEVQRDPGPVLLFIHGGGFVIGGLDVYASVCAHIARRTGLPVVSVDYRLAPEHPFPAAPADCEAAARWVAGGPAELGLAVTGIVPLGDSAGGNLAITTTQALMRDPAAVPVLCQFPIYPVVDATGDYASGQLFGEGYLLDAATMQWFHDHYAADPADHRASPLLADHAGTPPTLIVTAGLDPLRDQGRAYAAALAEAGVDVTYREAAGNIHGFITLRQAIPSSGADLDACLSILNDMIAEAVQRGAA